MSSDASAWQRREAASLADAMRRRSDPAFGATFVSGHGCRLIDADGDEWIDLTCGYSAANFGHAFAPLVQAAQSQLVTLTHLTGLSHPGRVLLAEKLIEHCGKPNVENAVVFNTGGARAVETAIKAAVSYRPGKVIAISPAFHGRSVATSLLSETNRTTLSATDSAAFERRSLREFAYPPACRHCAVRDGRTCDLTCQLTLIDYLEQRADEISVVIFEPVVGARGYLLPPHDYWLRIAECCKRLGILLIADEIQVGLGRGGAWLYSHRIGVQADLAVLGKSLGGGVTPISAVVGRRDVLDALPAGCESETFAGSPLGTAVGLAVIEQLEAGPWMRRADEIGDRLRESLGEQFGGERVEGAAGWACVEFLSASSGVDLSARVESAAREARAVSDRLIAARLLVHYTGPFATRIALIPPLTMTDEDISEVIHRCRSIELL
ncbi:MAG: aminotransferase class III-fold pyridoxal phosphate-dependent enzyme [Pirellulales bacterium]